MPRPPHATPPPSTLSPSALFVCVTPYAVLCENEMCDCARPKLCFAGAGRRRGASQLAPSSSRGRGGGKTRAPAPESGGHSHALGVGLRVSSSLPPSWVRPKDLFVGSEKKKGGPAQNCWRLTAGAGGGETSPRGRSLFFHSHGCHATSVSLGLAVFPPPRQRSKPQSLHRKDRSRPGGSSPGARRGSSGARRAPAPAPPPAAGTGGGRP
jgi:hypothetical protein